MKNLNPGSENGRRNGVVGLGLKPDQVHNTINVKVSYGLNEYEVAIPSNSNFGDLKSIIAQKYGLNPETHKLFFRGKEKEDSEYLEAAGVKDNSKVLLVEDTPCEQQTFHEEVIETNVISKGGEAVAKVKEEVDKLSEQISALQAVVDSGNKVEDKNFIFLSEMLMRQLLKLDGIEAEGEGRVQRKMEVRRVQSLVEKVDLLKSRNSNPSSNVDNTAPIITQLQSSEPPSGSVPPSAPSLAPSSPSATAPCFAPVPAPSSSTSSPAPSSIPSHVPYSDSAASHVSYSDSAPIRVSYPVLYPSPPHVPYSAHDSAHSQVPYSAPAPVHPYAAPSYAQSSYDAPYSYAPSHYGTPNSYAPSPHEANYWPYPYASTPYSQTPYAPIPYASTSCAPSQYAPTPYAAPNPYDSSYYTPPPPPMPSYDPYSRPSYDPSGTQSYNTTSRQSYAPSPTPPSSKVTENWERFE